MILDDCVAPAPTPFSSPAKSSETTPAQISEISDEKLSYIVYLEPASSQFQRSLGRFLEQSLGRRLANEAHLYHPHCSMTGFFDMPASAGADLLEARMTAILDDMINASLKNAFTLAADNGLIDGRNWVRIGQLVMPSATTMRLTLEVSPRLKQLAQEFKQRFDPFMAAHHQFHHRHHWQQQQQRNGKHHHHKPMHDEEIRLKPMDHISLCYLHTPALKADSSQELKPLTNDIVLNLYDQLADPHSSLHLPMPANGILDEWNIVLYELVGGRSQCLTQRHLLREIHRWSIPNTAPTTTTASISANSTPVKFDAARHINGSYSPSIQTPPPGPISNRGLAS